MKQRRRLLALLLASTIAMGSFTGALALTDEDVKDSTAAQSNVAEDATEMDRQILFNDDWKFYLGDASGAQEKNFNDSSWRDVTLPHDWSIELDFTNGATTSEIGHLAGGIGWYRKVHPPAGDGGQADYRRLRRCLYGQLYLCEWGIGFPPSVRLYAVLL